MINSKMLKNKILERGYTIEKISEYLDIKNNSFILKLNSDIEFTVLEVTKLCILLRLSHKEAEEIFFS